MYLVKATLFDGRFSRDVTPFRVAGAVGGQPDFDQACLEAQSVLDPFCYGYAIQMELTEEKQ